MKNLTPQHYNDIEFLINISGHILKQYQKLMTLENNNQKDNIDELIKDIESSKKVENSIIDRLCSEEGIIPSLLKYFNFDDKQNGFDNPCLINGNETELIYLRLANKIGLKDKKITSQDDISKIGYYVHLDLINTVLNILNNYLKENKDYNLIQVKYRIIFTQEKAENTLLEKNFNIEDNLYWTSLLYADLIKLDSEKLNFIKSSVGISLFFSQIKEFILYESYKKVYSNILIRASLLFLHDENINLIKNKLVELSEIGKIMGDNTDYIALFKDYEKDRELPQIIRARRKS